jgi:hypothetical protein
MSTPPGTPRSLDTIENIFHAALALPPESVDTFLERSCAGDASLRRQVEVLRRLIDRQATSSRNP